ncbi:hypothetical protein FrEUN1fDRAFT_5890 [Parafrankia sp. EUN1f]|nr:hypothetical protein FrEUN1fDRAFT_5890 [Parafrankia sp. EUN1f]
MSDMQAAEARTARRANTEEIPESNVQAPPPTCVTDSGPVGSASTMSAKPWMYSKSR